MKYILRLKLFELLKARPGLRISIIVSGFVYILLQLILRSALRPTTCFLIALDSGTICFLTLVWLMALQATPEKMRLLANRQYQGQWVILAFVIGAACSSLLAIFYMLADTKGLTEFFKTLHIILAVITVMSSWFLIHTMFALQYAHNYYYQPGSLENLNSPTARGLDFPDENQPDYWDFLYYSFVIGMTSQVSDVQVRSPSMRRLTLVHSVLTFFFNTLILALSINIIAGLI